MVAPKLTEQDVAEIKLLQAHRRAVGATRYKQREPEALSDARLARHYGVSNKTLHDIRYGYSWKWVRALPATPENIRHCVVKLTGVADLAEVGV